MRGATFSRLFTHAPVHHETTKTPSASLFSPARSDGSIRTVQYGTDLTILPLANDVFGPERDGDGRPCFFFLKSGEGRH